MEEENLILPEDSSSSSDSDADKGHYISYLHESLLLRSLLSIFQANMMFHEYISFQINHITLRKCKSTRTSAYDTRHSSALRNASGNKTKHIATLDNKGNPVCLGMHEIIILKRCKKTK